MRGSTLVEFLCATTFFLMLALSGFKALDAEMQISKTMLQRTRPEEESNYRLLALKAFFQSAAARFQKSAILAEVPFFFSGLNFGQEPSTSSFSLARPMADPKPFIRDGAVWRVPIDSIFAEDVMIAIAGSTNGLEFGWNYGRILTITPQPTELHLELELFLPDQGLISGELVPVEIHGFAHNENALYWIGPSGQSQPYFGPVEGFAYEWTGTQLKISWKAGLIDTYFVVTP